MRLLERLLPSLPLLLEARSLLQQSWLLIEQQNQVIARMQNAEIDVTLAYTRISRDMVAQFLITLNLPETQEQAREGLQRSLAEFNDEIARLEEQTR